MGGSFFFTKKCGFKCMWSPTKCFAADGYSTEITNGDKRINAMEPNITDLEYRNLE